MPPTMLKIGMPFQYRRSTRIGSIARPLGIGRFGVPTALFVCCGDGMRFCP